MSTVVALPVEPAASPSRPDPTAELPRLVRPFTAIAATTLSWAAIVATPSLVDMGANWEEPWVGIGVWRYGTRTRLVTDFYSW